MADAMSRFAYPASSAREDVSFHGSADAKDEMRKIIEKEIQEGRMVGLVYLGGEHITPTVRKQGCLVVAGGHPVGYDLGAHVRVVGVHALNGDVISQGAADCELQAQMSPVDLLADIQSEGEVEETEDEQATEFPNQNQPQTDEKKVGNDKKKWKPPTPRAPQQHHRWKIHLI